MNSNYNKTEKAIGMLLNQYKHETTKQRIVILKLYVNGSIFNTFKNMRSLNKAKNELLRTGINPSKITFKEVTILKTIKA